MYSTWIIYSNSLKIVKNAEQFKLVENQMNNKYMYVPVKNKTEQGV